MKLILKQKIFSLMDSYEIYDEYDQVVYTVSSRLSWGHKLDVYDPSGHCLEISVKSQEVRLHIGQARILQKHLKLEKI